MDLFRDDALEIILRGWAKAYRDTPEHRFPSDPNAEFFPIDLEAAANEIERLRKAVDREIDNWKKRNRSACAAERALQELHAMVWGECPSLLNEDSGGNARLDHDIRALIASPATDDGGRGE